MTRIELNGLLKGPNKEFISVYMQIFNQAVWEVYCGNRTFSIEDCRAAVQSFIIEEVRSPIEKSHFFREFIEKEDEEEESSAGAKAVETVTRQVEQLKEELTNEDLKKLAERTGKRIAAIDEMMTETTEIAEAHKDISEDELKERVAEALNENPIIVEKIIKEAKEKKDDSAPTDIPPPADLGHPDGGGKATRAIPRAGTKEVSRAGDGGQGSRKDDSDRDDA